MFEYINYSLLITVGIAFIIIGILGIVQTSQNIISVLMCMELLTCGMSLIFVSLSLFNQDPIGQLFAFFLITVAAAEAGIGLGLVVLTDITNKTIDHQKLCKLKG